MAGFEGLNKNPLFMPTFVVIVSFPLGPINTLVSFSEFESINTRFFN